MNEPQEQQQTGASDTFVRPCLDCGITIHVVNGRELDHLHHVFEADESRTAYAWWQGYDAASSMPNVPSSAPAGEALVQQIAEAMWAGLPEWERDRSVPEDLMDQARAVLPLVEAQVAPLRDAQGQMWLMWSDERRRADAAESALRQVREDLTALADSLKNHRGSFDTDRDVALNGIQNRLTDLLARVGAADTQPEGARCRDCGIPWVPVRRGECAGCGSDAGPTAGGKVDTAPEADEPCLCGTGFTCMARHETGAE